MAAIVASVGIKAAGALIGGKLSTLNKQVQFAQRRRQFIRAARSAQAAALVQGQASGASLRSSAVQGNLASLQTQEAVALTEFGAVEQRNRKIGGLTESAGNLVQQGQQVEKLANFAGDAVSDIFV
jgi:hypothetical protein